MKLKKVWKITNGRKISLVEDKNESKKYREQLNKNSILEKYY